jgi:tetratricopeptide (TPR) repeat protein
MLPLSAVLTIFTLLVSGEPGASTTGESPPAQKAWQLGQTALDHDRFEEAIGHFQVSLRLDPGMVQNHLSIAAAYLALGQQKQSIPHLAAYLEARPHHFLIRWHYAEVLMNADRLREALGQLERFLAAAQEHPRIAEEHMVACHTRMMELAERQGDDYREHLHRGIGLFLLAQKRAEVGESSSRKLAEELLCKAAAELTLARVERPSRARPCWYLYGVWTSLAQRQPAMRWLREAERYGPMNDLTPAERRELYLAAAERKREAWKK